MGSVWVACGVNQEKEHSETEKWKNGTCVREGQRRYACRLLFLELAQECEPGLLVNDAFV